MWLRCLNLINFQKHSNLTLDFVSGVNYLYGSSDAGKSCIRRAIGFVFFGDPRTDVIRKEGTKQTSVTAVLDNGIEIERIKSASINRYVIRKDGKETVYDSIGASVPEDVQKILQVTTVNVDDKDEPLNLNIAEQIALPFLLDKSGSFRLKLFNKLTGNDLVDKVVQNLNKEILSIGRDIKSAQEFIESNEPKLKEVTIQHEEKATLLGNLQEIRSSLLIEVDEYNKLKDLQTKLTTVQKDIGETKEKITAIKIIPQETIDELKRLIDEWIALDDLKEAWDAKQKAIAEAELALKAIKIPEIDIEAVKAEIEQLEALKRLQSDLGLNSKAITATEDEIVKIKVKIQALDKEYQDKLKEAGVCPICGQDVTNCAVHL